MQELIQFYFSFAGDLIPSVQGTVEPPQQHAEPDKDGHMTEYALQEDQLHKTGAFPAPAKNKIVDGSLPCNEEQTIACFLKAAG